MLTLTHWVYKLAWSIPLITISSPMPRGLGRTPTVATIPGQAVIGTLPLFISLLFSFLISHPIASEPPSLNSGASVPASLPTEASDISHFFRHKLKGVPTTVHRPCLICQYVRFNYICQLLMFISDRSKK